MRVSCAVACQHAQSSQKQPSPAACRVHDILTPSRSAPPNPAHDQIPLRALHRRQEVVQGRRQLKCALPSHLRLIRPWRSKAMRKTGEHVRLVDYDRHRRGYSLWLRSRISDWAKQSREQVSKTATTQETLNACDLVDVRSRVS